MGDGAVRLMKMRLKVLEDCPIVDQGKLLPSVQSREKIMNRRTRREARVLLLNATAATSECVSVVDSV